MKETKLCSLIVITLLLSVVTVHAAQLLFIPELSLTEEYSDNIFLDPENEEEEDFITTVGVGLTAQLIGRTAGLELSYNPSYSFFKDNTGENASRHSARLLAWDDITRYTRFELTNTYLESEDPRDSTEEFTTEDDPLMGPAIDVDYNRQGRDRYRENVTLAELTHRFGANDLLSVGLTYSFFEDLETAPGETLDDHDNWQPSLALNYWVTPRWGIETTGYYSNRDYVDRNDREESTGSLRLLYNFTRALSGYLEYSHTLMDFEEDTDDDYQIYEPAIGFRYHFQEIAHISLALAYFYQDFDQPTNQEDEKGFNINSEIFKIWAFRNGYINLSGASGYEIDDTGAEDLGLNIYYEGRLELGHSFSPRLSANIYGSYRWDEYPNETPERTDKTLLAGTGLIYQALSWMNVRLNYNYTDADSDIDEEEYTENSIILTITMAPVRPYRLN